MGEIKYVYCAGPFFNPEERQSMEEIAILLEKNGYKTFLPHRDGIEAYYLKAKKKHAFNTETDNVIRKAIFTLDVFQVIERCNSLVFNMNGRVPEEGGVFKASLAYAAGKPLVIYKNDNRSTFHGYDNGMIIGLSCTFSSIAKLKKISKELKKAEKIVASKGTNPYLDNIPPTVKAVVDLGRQIWNVLERNPLSQTREEDYPLYIEQLSELCKKSLSEKQSLAQVDAPKGKAYCSGPLFCPEEMGVMSGIASVLERDGYNTYLPHRDGAEAFVMNAVDNLIANALIFKPFTRFVNKAIFALDIYQIVDECDSFVFNMNGRVPDEGGVVETAVAFAAGKPIVVYKSDDRSAFFGSDCPAILGATLVFFATDTMSDIPQELKKAAENVSAFGRSSYRENIPPCVLKTVRFGYTVQRLIDLLQPFKPKNMLLKRKAL